jgi:hypothetical protein
MVNFKPTKWKFIVSLIVLVVWYFVVAYQSNLICAGVDCRAGGFDNCVNYEYLSLIKGACCGCMTLGRAILNNVKVIAPFFIVYIIWSLFEKRR